jgi:hypothetical protein
MVSELLVRNVTRKGDVMALDKDAIRMIRGVQNRRQG